MILVWVGLFVAITWLSASERFGIGFSLPELIDNFQRAERIVAQFLDPEWDVFFASRIVDAFLETLQMAIIGAVIGCSLALVFAFLASRVSAPGTGAFVAGKAVLNLLRAIPDVMYALVFVALVGIGALPGILALILFNIGVVAKLLSETVDGVDLGPIEAAHAAGASQLQAIRTGIFPQVLPNYIAYSLYTFELNLRASAVLGFVGAGGIGEVIDVFRNAFEYERVAIVIIQIFLIVFVVETVSIALRRRLV